MKLTIRDIYHLIVGFAIGYLSFVICGINIKGFPISVEYWNNSLTPLLALIPSMLIGGAWEKWQEKKFNATFDLKDVFKTGFGGVLGGVVAMFFVSWWLIIALPIISVYLVAKHYKI